MRASEHKTGRNLGHLWPNIIVPVTQRPSRGREAVPGWSHIKVGESLLHIPWVIDDDIIVCIDLYGFGVFIRRLDVGLLEHGHR